MSLADPWSEFVPHSECRVQRYNGALWADPLKLKPFFAYAQPEELANLS